MVTIWVTVCKIQVQLNLLYKGWALSFFCKDMIWDFILVTDCTVMFDFLLESQLQDKCLLHQAIKKLYFSEVGVWVYIFSHKTLWKH